MYKGQTALAQDDHTCRRGEQNPPWGGVCKDGHLVSSSGKSLQATEGFPEAGLQVLLDTQDTRRAPCLFLQIRAYGACISGNLDKTLEKGVCEKEFQAMRLCFQNLVSSGVSHTFRQAKRKSLILLPCSCKPNAGSRPPMKHCVSIGRINYVGVLKTIKALMKYLPQTQGYRT